MKDYGLDLDIAENGKTYFENAYIKASKIHQITGKTVIADDSGFELEYLNNEPGIYSKRYLDAISFKEKIKIILDRMKDIVNSEQRCMKLVGSLVCITSNRIIIHCDFFLDGLCAYEPQGDSDIDYYKIMYLPKYGKTVAELSPSKWFNINPRITDIKQIYIRIHF